MSAVGRFATAAAVGLTALSLLPAIPAAASPAAARFIPASALPADCTYTRDFTTQSLTCTARPETQVWEQEAVCVAFPGPKYYTLYGNRVTGDGTSSITCSGTFETPSFYVVS